MASADFDIELKLPNFGPMTEATRAGLRPAVVSLTQRLASLVRAKLSGGVLQRRSGRLLGSIRSELVETTDSIGGRVSTSGVPYARIHEYGGQTSPHVIMARNSSSLAFVWQGQMRFFKKVNHPGSKIPARPYMSTSLEEMREEIRATYERAGQAAASRAAHV